MTTQASGFPELPAAAELVVDEPFWRFHAPRSTPGGVAHLRIWATAVDRVQLAVATELGLGLSITNGIEHIWNALAAEYPAEQLVLLEHWPAAESQGEEHLDQVVVVDGEPRWRRVWPTPPDNPNHDTFNDWMATFGPTAGMSSKRQ